MKIKNNNFSPNTTMKYTFTRPISKNGEISDYFGYLMQINKAAMSGNPDTLKDWNCRYMTIQNLRTAGLLEAVKEGNDLATLQLTDKGLDYVVYHAAFNKIHPKKFLPESKIKREKQKV